ncbi:MAG TPA: serine/threonine-protein kinase [Polyangiales bacterium]|nr:serine/threonine-protein kinase [Polyangiales bacterium]
MRNSSAKDMASTDPDRRRRLSGGSIAPTRSTPEKIGRYELCFELASGGMASVYLARAAGAPGFQKLVALKRIHAHLAKEKEYVEMFLDEARIASRITHANVCSVFDFGEVNGEYFIAMEYLVGEPLSRVHRRVVANAEERSSPLLPSRMARIIAQAAEGLHAAHELNDADGQSLNVVHRDVSAENLFVTYDGDTQVVDFGIAHARQRVHHTEAGQVKGTFPYMAPEQMTAAVVDRRVDVWALGAVLWELLTLRRLFLRDTDVNTMYAVLSGEIRPPSEYRSDVPPELDEIVLKALQRNPDERWQSAREMGKALRRFLAKQEELVGPAEIAEWMAELFPNGEARKHHLMEIARTSPDQIAADSPYQSELKSQRRNMAIPSTAKYRVPAPPPLPASLLVMVIGVATVLTLVALDWLRQ